MGARPLSGGRAPLKPPLYSAYAEYITHPRLLIKPGLGLVELLLEGGTRLGQVAVAAVQLLHLALQFVVLLRQASLPAVEVLVLTGQLVVLGLEATQGVLQTFQLRLGVSLTTTTSYSCYTALV